MYLVNSKYGNTCVKNTKLCKLILGDNTYLPTDYDNTAKFKCDTCYDGYSKSTTTFECKKCPADGDVACTKCEATYTGTVPNCLNCVTGINRGFYTDTTKVNYYLAAGACKACDANCLTCDATGCSAC